MNRLLLLGVLAGVPLAAFADAGDRIGFRNPLATPPPGFLAEKGLRRLTLEGNRLLHVSKELQTKDPR